MILRMSRLREQYKKEVIPSLMAGFKYKSVSQVPAVSKIVINVGIGKVAKENQRVKSIENQLALISGQKAALAQAKKSISGFKVRAGMPIGLKVTLRGERMYEFLDRLINVAIPRTRDFSGIGGKVFDENGNASIGIKDSSIFPELISQEASEGFSLAVTIATSAKTNQEAKKLLTSFGFPFKDKDK